jgi:hypothetical protein
LARWYRDSGATQVLAGPQQVLVNANAKSERFVQEVAVEVVRDEIELDLNN